jgi:SPP1 family phage portal protein
LLKIEEIMQFIQDDATSEKKLAAGVGQKYYEGRHDILNYRMFYFNDDGQPVEDKFRSNIKITHPFFTELVDQAVQYILSGNDGIIKSDNPALQAELDAYFNANEDFVAELAEVITGCMAKGYEYMYAYKNADDKLAFQCADCLGVVEVRAKDTDDNCEYVIYRYVDRVEKGRKLIHRIQVWDDKQTWFYVQKNNDKLELDESEPINPKPHVIFTEEGSPEKYFEGFGFIPFFRLDNNKKQVSGLATIKDLIDDYDLMASSLSNNLVDFDTPIHVVKGFEGDLDEMIHNLKVKKHMGVPEGGEFERQVIDVPYQARQVKLELDEKNIYRFGMGLNTSGLKDTSATTNIAIKAAYSLLDLKATKFEIKLKQFLRKILKIVLAEINDQKGTDFQMSQIYFEFDHEVMSNAQENAQIDLILAQKQQTTINTLLALADRLDNETIIQNICDVLELDYNEIKHKLPDPDEAVNNLIAAGGMLGGGVVE